MSNKDLISKIMEDVESSSLDGQIYIEFVLDILNEHLNQKEDKQEYSSKVYLSTWWYVTPQAFSVTPWKEQEYLNSIKEDKQPIEKIEPIDTLSFYWYSDDRVRIETLRNRVQQIINFLNSK